MSKAKKRKMKHGLNSEEEILFRQRKEKVATFSHFKCLSKNAAIFG